jgi:O-antigen/teichoic acid export membrane protein
LSKLAPSEVVGWHAASQKLIGLLVFPAGALIAALYPVLCRLFAQDHAAYVETAGSVIRASLMFVVPAAFGCGLFPEIGVMILGKEGYGPVADNLRFLSVFVFLVYFSMPVGSVLLAGGRARVWSLVQGICVVSSLVLNPLLIPWFQDKTGNGGLGVCVSTTVSEALMVGIGVWLLPSGTLGMKALKALLSALAAGAAMSLVAWLMSGLHVLLAVPFALVAFVLVAWATGGFAKNQIDLVRDVVRRKANA